MATISDVEAAFIAIIYQAVYPNSSPPSILGYPVKIYPGWPDPDTLDADLVETAPGVPTAAHVSVYPLPQERNVTRYLNDNPQIGPLNAATYSLTVSGYAITVGGVPPVSPYIQNLAVFVAGKPYVAPSTGTQTADEMAALLAALIAVDQPGTTVVGAIITVPSPLIIGALRIGATAAVNTEVRRQEKQFQISVWSSNPTSRAAISDLFDPVLAASPFLSLADGSAGRSIYYGSREDDFLQKQRIYRRSTIWQVEYPTTITTVGTEIIAVSAEIEDRFGDVFATQYA